MPNTADARVFGDLSQTANHVIAKIRCTCRQPELADEVLDVINRTLQTARASGDGAHVGSRCLAECHRLIRSDDASDRELAISLVNQLLASAYPDTSLPEEPGPAPSVGPTVVRWDSDVPAPWTLARRDRDVLLGLVRGYRFLASAREADYTRANTTPEALARKLRALDVKAALQGITV